MKMGEYYAGCMVYGYQKSSDGKSMEVDEGAAVTIRRIFQELAGGKDAKTLAIELNAEGVPTRLTYKQAKGEQLNRHYKADIWNRNKIHSIIHNRVYPVSYTHLIIRILGKSCRINLSKIGISGMIWCRLSNIIKSRPQILSE